MITSIIFRDKLDNTSVYTFNGNNTHFGTTYTKVEEVNKTLKFEITGGEDRKTNPKSGSYKFDTSIYEIIILINIFKSYIRHS